MKVCKDAVNKWGETSQMLVAAEEAAELNQAILKYINRGGSINEVIQELADVIIMVEQLKLMVSEKKLKSQLARKEKRLKELIRNK